MSTFVVSARYMILGSLGFALMGVCVKLAGQQGMPLLEIIAARALVSLILSVIDIKRKGIALLGNDKLLLMVRGLVGSLALMCVYYALLHMPFAEATVIQYLNPLFTAVLAAVFLGERLQKVTLIAIIVSLLGLLLVVQPEILSDRQAEPISMWVAFIALLGAIGSAVAYVVVRKLAVNNDPSVIILYFPLIALPLSLLLLGRAFVVPEGITWVILLLVGIFTQIGQWGLTKAIQLSPAGAAMSLSYMQVVFALVLGVVFFNEIPNILALLGIAIIVLATMLSVTKQP